jgi:hypothetical protein
MDFSENSGNNKYQQSNIFLTAKETILNNQLEMLKEKIQKREAELIEIINNQREEYEKNLQERDEEVINLVDQIESENQDLKKKVINCEIEKEYYKETLEEYKKNNDFAFFDEENINNEDLESSKFQGKNNPTADKLFFQGIKIITEINENKQRELNEKYDMIFYGFLKEKSQEFEKLKEYNFSKEIYEKIINKNFDYEEEHYLPIDLFENNYLYFENKIKLLFEELKNQEGRALQNENKFNLLTEENRALKRKFNEEKKFLLNKIYGIKSENEKTHRKIILKLEEEIREKKVTLEKRVGETLKLNEEIIQSLLREKNEISNNFREVEKKLWISSQEIQTLGKEFQLKEQQLQNMQNEQENLTKELKFLIEESKKEKILIENLEKTNSDYLEKLNESYFKINSIEAENKILQEKYNLKLIENEKILFNHENLIKDETDRLNNHIIKYERKAEDYLFDNKKYLENIKALENTINLQKEINEKLNKDLGKLKIEINEVKLNNKNLMGSLEDKLKEIEKTHNKFKELEFDLIKKDDLIKANRENIINLEKENFDFKFENEKLQKAKKDLFEESKKKILYYFILYCFI